MKILSELTAGKVKESKLTATGIIGASHHQSGKSWRNVALTHETLFVIGPEATIGIPIEEILDLAAGAEPALSGKKK